jgi:hypothetical protein
MRPTTDIISNNILIQALREGEGLNGILKGKLPRSIMSAFLHEVTHHWCFLSPVAVAIAALRARGDQDLWRAKTRDDVQQAARFRVISEKLGEVYRPLSEGLALFGQHHLRMEPEGLAAEPLYWTTQHFRDDPALHSRLLAELQDPHDLRPEDIPDELFEQYCASTNALLDETRRAESEIEEIRRIAQSRLDAAGDGYLPGLLLIKRAFNRIARLRPDIAAPTTFLLWAKEFLFHDTELALDAIMGKSPDPFARLRKRPRLFESDRAADLMERYAQQASTTGRSFTVGSWVPTLPEGLDLAPGGDKALYDRLGELLDVANMDAQDPPDLVSWVAQYRSIVRDLVLLGRIPGRLKRVNPASPQLNGLPEAARAAMVKSAGFLPDPATGLRSLMFVPLPAPLAAPVVDVTLDLLFWSSANRLVLALYAGVEPVTQLIKSDGLTPAAVDVCKAGLQERLAMEENIKKVSDRAKEVLDWAFIDFDDNVQSQLRKQTDALLRERLFDSLGGNAAAAFERFRERGLYELFDTMERPDDFARLCAAASCAQRIKPAEVGDMLAWSAAQEGDLGFPLLSIARDLVQTAL